ncbi:MAG: hypothetical protein AB8H79_24475 [Myxococcota bacterium]
MDVSEILGAAHRAFINDYLDEALVLLTAVESLPSPRMWMLRADLHRERCEPELARAALRRAVALGAGDAARLRSALMWSPIMGDSASLDAEWRRVTEDFSALERSPLILADPVVDLPWMDFYLAYRGGADRALREQLGRILARAHPSLGFVAPHVESGVPADVPIRIGFCSSHLRDHTIGRLNEALIRGLSDYGFVVVLAVPEASSDGLYAELADAADEVLVLGRDLAVAQRRLSDAHLHVLHYPDLGMDPFTMWLAYSRFAAVQTMSWGHPITSGLPTIDAFFATETLVPPDQDHQFCERVVRLPEPMVCWTPPPDPAPMGREALGLPEGRRIYLVPQTAFKLHPDFDSVLGQILDEDPDGVIALLAPSRRGWRSALETRMGRCVDLARVVWVPRQPRHGFLALLREADVVLDPFPFAGGHTSLEALAMGTPVVTCATQQLRGRLTLLWYRTMGLRELACDSVDTYVERAVRWAHDGAVVRRRIASATPLLFGRADAVAGHAAAFHSLLAQAERSACAA